MSKLVRDALNSALRLRSSKGIQIADAFCIYDLAAQMDIEVRFVEIPKLEGMYWMKSPPLILISSLRPPGRQRYTCAHEIAHHISGKGFHIDEFNENLRLGKKGTSEFFADVLAGFLLMPKTTVMSGFARRKWNPVKTSPHQVYTISSWLGVGYATLIRHMQAALQTISSTKADELLRYNPKKFRTELFGIDPGGNLIPVDYHWTGRPIDIQVDDFILAPSGIRYEGHARNDNRKLTTRDNLILTIP
jgi:Zn-dependent peptidase ImmA (M78 family)